jgi:hypothetical protein
VPLAVAGISADVLPANSIRILIDLNRVNDSPATILLTSSNPAVAAVPATFTIPAFTAPCDFRFASLTIPYQPTGGDTAVAISALFGGAKTTATITIPKIVDTVKIARAELTVKTGSLKVDATSTSPSAVLSIFNAATGQFIGTMTNAGPSGGGAKYSFQGTVPSPVQTLLLRSSLNGSATGAVTQK